MAYGALRLGWAPVRPPERSRSCLRARVRSGQDHAGRAVSEIRPAAHRGAADREQRSTSDKTVRRGTEIDTTTGCEWTSAGSRSGNDLVLYLFRHAGQERFWFM